MKDLTPSTKDYLERYFVDLGNKKNNFFTDISNYLLYELGQPTHCYDMKKMKSNITFKKLKVPRDFEALNGKVFISSRWRLCIQ